MKTGMIYRVTSPSGKVYIGKTMDSLHRRKARHMSRAKTEITKFYSAIRKYGDALVWEPLYSEVPQALLAPFEATVISMYDSKNNGYNGTDGGDGTCGWKHSTESKTKMAKCRIGKKASKETRAKMSAANAGRKPSAAAIEACRLANTGKIVTDETRRKMSESAKKRTRYPLSEATKRRISIAVRSHYEAGRNNA